MKENIIRTEHELKTAVRNLLKESILPSFSVSPQPKSARCDFLAEAELDGKNYRFAVECKLNPAVRDLEHLKSQAGEDALLLASVRVTDSLLSHCKRLNINCIDLNGRVWLREKGLLIDRNEPLRQVRFRLAERPVNFFSAKSARLARILLSHPGRYWRQNDVADLAGLSQGLLSRLLNGAADQGWVQGSRGDWVVADSDGILNAWEKADDWQKRGVLRQYSILESDFEKLARHLLKQTVGEIAFTQWFAANLRFPYAESPVVSAYRQEFPSEEELRALKLREVSGGAKLWIIVPNDAGVFQGVRRAKGFPIVSDVQIYLDLLQVGLRGPDQAHALREWEGFCKP